ESRRHPSEGEERGFHLRALEHAQQPLGVRAHAALARVPAAAIDHAIEGADLKVILDVHAHRVDDRSRWRRRGRAWRHAPRRSTTVLIVSKMMKRSRLIEKFLM